MFVRNEGLFICGRAEIIAVIVERDVLCEVKSILEDKIKWKRTALCDANSAVIVKRGAVIAEINEIIVKAAANNGYNN